MGVDQKLILDNRGRGRVQNAHFWTNVINGQPRTVQYNIVLSTYSLCYVISDGQVLDEALEVPVLSKYAPEGLWCQQPVLREM